MIYDWYKLLADKGDIDAMDWLENERFKIELLFMHPDEEEYYASPRPSNVPDWDDLWSDSDYMWRQMRGDFR
jgi:hypothetical protein